MIADSELLRMALLAALASLTAGLLIVYTERWHGAHSLDSDLRGAQKFHKTPVPRIGGMALAAGLAAIAFLILMGGSRIDNDQEALDFIHLLIAGMPAFIAGMVEDLTKKVSVTSRLLATFASALLASWLLGATLPRLDVWGFDLIFQLAPAALVITAFAVAGVANSINIIDGFNGLAGSTVVIILAALGLVAWQVDDRFVAMLAFVGLGTAVGFLILNYPTGRLFMGDGGAYLMGFWIAEVAVLTILRNPSVSAWQMLAICAYPIIEVVFSMYRRKVVQRSSIGAPDRLHLHSLVYRRLVCQHLPRNESQPWIRNATVACVMALWIAPATMLSVLLGGTTASALFIIAIQLFSYLAFYARLVRGHWCFNPVVVFGLRPEHRVRVKSL